MTVECMPLAVLLCAHLQHPGHVEGEGVGRSQELEDGEQHSEKLFPRNGTAGHGNHRHTTDVVSSTRPPQKTERGKRGSAWEKEVIKNESRKTGYGDTRWYTHPSCVKLSREENGNLKKQNIQAVMATLLIPALGRLR